MKSDAHIQERKLDLPNQILKNWLLLGKCILLFAKPEIYFLSTVYEFTKPKFQ